MRDSILAEALGLLVIRGYERFHFGLVAEVLDCTRPNIHYHFRTKQDLVETVVVEYVSGTEERFHAIWRDVDTTLTGKIAATRDYNFKRYLRFNPTETTGNPWSLIARMRSSIDLLTPKARQSLRNFGPNVEDSVREAIGLAKGKGELLREAPVDEITVLIVSIINSAGPITQDAGNFARLDTLYSASARIIAHAYGARAQG